MNKETLYINFNPAVKVTDRTVHLKDIASFHCSDQNLLNRIKTVKICTFPKDENSRIIFSALKIFELILKEHPNMDIRPTGETDIIIEYQCKKNNTAFGEYIKVSLICIIIFFGSAFTIMAFNNDVSVAELFRQVYEQTTGKTHDGFSIMEVMYSFGIFLGILIFYNHFGKKKITSDPTPIEVEMRLYEQDINTTLIDGIRRKEEHVDVDMD